MSALVDAVGLRRVHGHGAASIVALAGIDLVIRPGDRLAITGPSGAGKSTLLNLLGALDRDYQGTLCVQGRELRTLDDSALSLLRNRSIGFVFQSFHLLPGLDVGSNLLLPAAFDDRADLAAARRRAEDLLRRVGLDPTSLWRRRPLELSGGQRQRVAIARALLLRPPLLLCDEPTGSLDAAHAAEVLDLFDEVSAQDGSALVAVTHDPAVVRRLGRVLALRAGSVEYMGAPRAEAG